MVSKVNKEEQKARAIRFVKSLTGFEKVFVSTILRGFNSSCECFELTGETCIICEIGKEWKQ